MWNEGRLDYIHSYLWCPARTKSMGGCRFFLIFIDDFCRRVWVYIIKSKDEVFQKFRECKTLIEKQTSHKNKRIKTNNGLEFRNENFDSFCCEKNYWHKEVTYTPKHDGLVEKMNITILERARSMLLSSKLPIQFWAKDVKI